MGRRKLILKTMSLREAGLAAAVRPAVDSSLLEAINPDVGDLVPRSRPADFGQKSMRRIAAWVASEADARLSSSPSGEGESRCTI